MARQEISGDVSLRRPGLLYVVAVGVSRYKTPELNLDFSAATPRHSPRPRFAEPPPPGRSERQRSPTIGSCVRTSWPRRLRWRVGRKVSPPRRLAGTLAALDAAKPEDAVLLFFSGHWHGRGKVIFTSFCTIPPAATVWTSRMPISSKGSSALMRKASASSLMRAVREPR